MVSVLPQITPTGRYCIKEAASLLGVSVSTIYNYVNKGRLVLRYDKFTTNPRILGKDITAIWKGER